MVLNIVLIPKQGLVGVGIATLSANFLYFFLSAVIVLPNLRLQYPKLTMLRMVISFIPFVGLYYLFGQFTVMSALFEMISLMLVFYMTYWFLSRTILKRPA